MVKVYYTYDTTEKEGFVCRTPNSFSENDSVDEIEGNVIEKVPDLVQFIEECYRVLRVGGTAKFTAPYYTSALAWGSPLNIRGVSEATLNFASKDWRVANKYTEADVRCDFEVVGNFIVDQGYTQRADEVKSFWLKHYNNVAQAVIFTLTKKALSDG